MLHIRFIDIDLNIRCDKRELGLVCPRKAIAEIYTEDNSRYVCRTHLNEAKQLEEERNAN